MNVTLRSFDGRHVYGATIPPVGNVPDVVCWGTALYVRVDRAAIGPLGSTVYTEACVYRLLTRPGRVAPPAPSRAARLWLWLTGAAA